MKRIRVLNIMSSIFGNGRLSLLPGCSNLGLNAKSYDLGFKSYIDGQDKGKTISPTPLSASNLSIKLFV